MKLIISPAKKMNMEEDLLEVRSLPAFLDRTQVLLDYMQGLDRNQAKTLWKCNDAIADLNYARIQSMDLHSRLTPAILAYEGIQYQYMAPAVFEDRMLSWVQEHLRILSGFYGVLRPMDGVTPYRLEMQARLSVCGCRDLYEFWGGRICEEALRAGNSDKIILNLASKEYSRCVERYLEPDERFVTCIFGEWSGGKIVQKGTYAKMARGEMVRFLAERQAESPEEAKRFDRLGYTFDSGHSDDAVYVFIRAEKELQEQQVR